MKIRAQNFALGLTAIVFAALIVGTILFLTPAVRAGGKKLEVHFRNEDGIAALKPGSPVVAGGSVNVGRVTDIRVDGRMIVVKAEVQSDLQIMEDCQVTTDQPAVGGGGTLVILSLGTSDKPLSGPVQGLPPQSLGAAIGQLSRRLLGPEGLLEKIEVQLNPDVESSLVAKVRLSIEDLNAMTTELRTQLSPAMQDTLLFKLHRLVDNVELATASLRNQTSPEDAQSLVSRLLAAVNELNGALSQAHDMLAENRPALRNSLSSIEHASARVDNEVLASLSKEFDRANPDSLLSKIHVSMDRASASLAEVQTISETGRHILVANRPTLERTVANFKDTSEQLRLAAEEIRIAPWRLLTAPAGGERDKLNIFEAARTFAEAATYLDDASARLQAVVAARDAGQLGDAHDDIEKIVASLKSAFERFQKAENFLYEKMK